MRKSIVFVGSTAAMLAAPFIASAQTDTVTVSQGIIGLIQFANTALNDVIILFVTLAIVALFYGIIKYVYSNAGKAKAASLTTIIYSIIAIFIMVSIWGIIHLLQSTFGVSSTDAAQAPSALQIQQ
jgi:hypothetical protein